MGEIEDCRGKSEYGLAELITACLAMFLFKTGSRNELNNLRKNPKFCKNYKKLFKMDLPHPDTVDRVMRVLSEEHLEILKMRMIKALLNKKALHKHRLQQKWFVVAIDGSGIVSFDHPHCENCLYKTSKRGKTTWFHNVLEAKLITENGFALSLATEWIENPSGSFDKQDCERKAFNRLAAKLKSDFPRLPICLTADSLYPYKGFFDVCGKYGWRYILTFKDGSLPSVWEEVEALKPLMESNRRRERIVRGKKRIEKDIQWVVNIDYKGCIIHWIECIETVDAPGQESQQRRFVHLTDFEIDYRNALEISATGRLRWKIENEGFNAQKNQGYNLSHKYARKSCRAMKNYYQGLQMAHIINQLLNLSQNFQELLEGKMTAKHLWKRLECLMSDGDVVEQEIEAVNSTRFQIRFVT